MGHGQKMISRRQIMLGTAAALLAPAQTQAREPHYISPYEESKVDYKYRKREVKFETSEPPGTIVVDTRKKFLYFVLPGGKAIRYGIGVGSKYSRWSGEAKIYRMAKWPTWKPTPEMFARSKRYEQWKDGMPGGPDNPLGSRALYLLVDGVDKGYRIHGTPLPETIGKATTQGCFRMLNKDVIELAGRVEIGTRVVVLPHDLSQRKKPSAPPN
jgi:lipoprotein-anchoring transpeptidase ErfK/SrfK